MTRLFIALLFFVSTTFAQIVIDVPAHQTEIYPNPITGNVDLIKDGAGTLQLDGDNSKTGTNTINDGTLLVTQNLQGHSYIGQAGTLHWDIPENISITVGSFNGLGNVLKTGAGDVISSRIYMPQTDTFDGLVTVQEGYLSMSNITGQAEIHSGATLFAGGNLTGQYGGGGLLQGGAGIYGSINTNVFEIWGDATIHNGAMLESPVIIFRESYGTHANLTAAISQDLYIPGDIFTTAPVTIPYGKIFKEAAGVSDRGNLILGGIVQPEVVIKDGDVTALASSSLRNVSMYSTQFTAFNLYSDLGSPKSINLPGGIQVKGGGFRSTFRKYGDGHLDIGRTNANIEIMEGTASMTTIPPWSREHLINNGATLITDLDKNGVDADLDGSYIMALNNRGELIKRGDGILEILPDSQFAHGSSIKIEDGDIRLKLFMDVQIGSDFEIAQNSKLLFIPQFGMGFDADITSNISGDGELRFSHQGSQTFVTGQIYNTGGTFVDGRLIIGDGGNISGDVYLTPSGVVVFTGTGSHNGANFYGGDFQKIEMDTNLTYTGNSTATTRIERGMLQIGDGGLAGEVDADIELSGGDLIWNRSGTITYSSNLTTTANGTVRVIGDGLINFEGYNASRSTTIEAGEYALNGTSLSTTSVLDGGRISGSGRQYATLTIEDGGTLAPGQSPGTITVSELLLNPSSVLEFELSTPGVVGSGVNDLIQVSGNLVLDGLLDVVDAGGFTFGTYRLIDYGGLLTDNGLTINSFPVGFNSGDFAVQTSIPGQVNLIVNDSPAGVVDFWNGSTLSPTGTVVGGSGIWNNNASNTNWTNHDGTESGGWQDGTSAIFAGSEGVVTLADDIVFGNLQFATSGYVVNGNGYSMQSNLPASEIRVDSGLATLNAGLTGFTDFTKTGAGILRLSANNTYAGNTTIAAGSLEITDGGGISNGDIAVEDGAYLTVNRTNSLTLANRISGSGDLRLLGTGSLYFTGIFSANRILIDNGEFVLQDGGSIGNSSVLGNGGFTVEKSGSDTFTQHFDVGSFAKTGTGSLFLRDAFKDLGATNIGDGFVSLETDITSTNAVVGNNPAANAIVSIFGGNWQMSENLTVGQQGNGDISISESGTLSSLGGSIGNSPIGVGVITVADGRWDLGNSILSVGRSGNGTLNIFENGIVNNNGLTFVGHLPGSRGTVDVRGGSLTSSNDLVVGLNGIGELNVYGGATTNSRNLNIGINASSSGEVFVDDATITNTGSTIVGRSGEAGLELSRNSTLTNNQAVIAQEAGSRGNVFVETGSTWENLDYLHVGASGIGNLNIFNGTVNAQTAQVGVFNGSFGGILIDGGELNIADTLTIGNEGYGWVGIDAGNVILGGPQGLVLGQNPSGDGNLNLNDGILETMQVSRGSGLGTFNFNGGELRLSANQLNLFDGLGSVNINGPSYNTTLNTNGFNVAISQNLVGSGGLTKSGLGNLILNGDNTYSGTTFLQEGNLQVNGLLGTGDLLGLMGTTLSGDGAIAGSVNTQGNVSPGRSPGTLTVGNLILYSTSTLEYELSTPGIVGSGVNDLIEVTGNLTLDGLLDVIDAGGFTFGTYRLINYGGLLTDNGLTINSFPVGFNVGDFAIQTSIAGQVNLVVNSPPPGLFEFWNGSTLSPTGTVVGGSGIWNNNALNTNWTNASGDQSGPWVSDRNAIFAGSSGVVTLGEDVEFGNMQFASDGYVINGNGNRLRTNLGDSEIRVDGGSAIINAEISGLNINKTGLGSLILNENNTYTGLTRINEGNLQVNGEVRGDVEVGMGTRLSGTGTLFENVDVFGTLAPGQTIGTITVGSLNLTPLSTLEFELSTPGIVGSGVNDLIEVVGDLTLDGDLNIIDAGGFTFGLYRLINYGGLLTDNGLTINSFPVGFNVGDFAIQTSIAGQVNLVVNSPPPGVFEFWNGSTLSPTGTVVGGSGVWDTTSTNWTNVDGDQSGAWTGTTAILAGDAGFIDLAQDTAFQNLQFASDGYVIEGNGFEMSSAGNSEIRVDSGRGTINADLTVENLNKTGTGDLAVGGEFRADDMLVSSGNFVVLDGGSIQGASVNIDGGDLVFERDGDYTSTATIFGSRIVVKKGNGRLDLDGEGNHTGGTVVESGTLAIAPSWTSGNIDNRSTTLFAGIGDDAFRGNLSGGEVVAERNVVVEGRINANNIHLGGNQMDLGSGGTSGEVSGNIHLENGIFNFNRSDDYVFNGSLQGSGNANKFGLGEVTLTSENNYTGGFDLQSGSVRIIDGASLNVDNLIVRDDAALVYEMDTNHTSTAGINAFGKVIKSGFGSLRFTDQDIAINNLVINSGEVITNSTEFNFVNIASGATMNFEIIAPSLAFDGITSGAGRMVKSGSGELRILGDTPRLLHTGPTDVLDGVLYIENFAPLGTLSIANGATARFRADRDIVFVSQIENAGLLDLTAGNYTLNASMLNTGTLRLSGATLTATTESVNGVIEFQNFSGRGSTLIIDQDFDGALNANLLSGSDDSILRKMGSGGLFIEGTHDFHGLFDLSEGSILLNNATLNHANFNVAEGAVLRGDALIGGNLQNAGMMAPVSIIRIGGDFNQLASGIFVVRVDSATDFSRLAVSGRANLDGFLRVERNPLYIPRSGDSLEIITAGGGVSGEFATVTGAEQFEVVYNANDVRLVADSTPPKPDPVDPGPDPIDVIETAADVAKTTSPIYAQELRETAKMLREVTAASFAFTSQPLKEIAFTNTSTSFNAVSASRGQNLWSQTTGVLSSVSGIGNIPRSDFQTGSFYGGAALAASPFASIGAYCGYNYTWLDGSMGGATVSAITAGIYANVEVGDWWAVGFVGGGANNYNLTRNDPISGRSARGKTSGAQIDAGLLVGRDFNVGRVVLSPFAGAQFSSLNVSGYTERGAGAMNARVASQNASSLRATVGLSASLPIEINRDWTVTPFASAYYQQEFLDNGYDMTVALANGKGSRVNVAVPAGGRSIATGSVGVSVNYKDVGNLYISGGMQNSSTQQSGFVNVGAGIKF